MKLIIEVTEDYYEFIKNNTLKTVSDFTILDGKPYEERKTGHWVYRHYNWWCSECGEQPKTLGYVGTAKFMYDEFKFCNHCGAKMTGGVIYE